MLTPRINTRSADDTLLGGSSIIQSGPVYTMIRLPEPDTLLQQLAITIAQELGYGLDMLSQTTSGRHYCVVYVSGVGIRLNLGLWEGNVRAYASHGEEDNAITVELADPDMLDKLVDFYKLELAVIQNWRKQHPRHGL